MALYDLSSETSFGSRSRRVARAYSVQGSDIGERPLEAARSSPRGGGCTPSGWASLWECRVSHDRRVRHEEAQGASWLGHCQTKGGHFDRAEEAQGASWGTAKGGHFDHAEEAQAAGGLGHCRGGDN